MTKELGAQVLWAKTRRFLPAESFWWGGPARNLMMNTPDTVDLMSVPFPTEAECSFSLQILELKANMGRKVVPDDHGWFIEVESYQGIAYVP